jgi:hypothetical protein
MTGFQRAIRSKVYLKLAITGPSGSGKTYSALRLAFGLAGKDGRVAIVDSENGSGSLYAHVGHYDQQQIAAPFTVQKYIAAIQEATAAGYNALIIDSLSHAWAGDGGLLDQKSAKDSRGGNSFSNWADVSKVYEQFKSVLLQSPIHIIGTMRSKQDYVIEQDSRGKSTPRKVGLAPIQREGMEYEFTTVFDVDMTHIAATSKDRTGLFTDEISQITESHGKRLAEWLAGGAAPTPLPPQQPETQQPETQQPETQQPETQQPETQQPETQQPAVPLQDALREKTAAVIALAKTLPASEIKRLKGEMMQQFGASEIKYLTANGLNWLEQQAENFHTKHGDMKHGDMDPETDPFDDANDFKSRQLALMEADVAASGKGHGDS